MNKLRGKVVIENLYQVGLGDANNYVQANKSLQKIYIQVSKAATGVPDTSKGLELAVYPLAGSAGFRQGGLSITMARLAGQEIAATWDGNPDCGQKMTVSNYGNNLDGATRIGGVRALDIQARNRGTNLAWVKTMELNARNDSGKNVSDMLGLHIRCENYGNIFTSNIGIDLEMSDENGTQAQEKVAMQIRNSDLSGMSAVKSVFKITHTSTNGFTNLFHFVAAAGDTLVAKTTAVGSLGNTIGYLQCLYETATVGRIPVFGEYS